MNKLTKSIITGILIVTGALSLMTTTAKAEESNTIDQKEFTISMLKMAYNHYLDFSPTNKMPISTPSQKMDVNIIGDAINVLRKYNINTNEIIKSMMMERMQYTIKLKNNGHYRLKYALK